MQNFKKTSAHKIGKKLKAVDDIAKALDAAIFLTKYCVIPVGTWLLSENKCFRIAAIVCSLAIGWKESQKN